jgi:short subunit dehydrogenase-like uncharacterized protein
VSEARWDLVLFGATGFTGRQVARYLDRTAHGVRWAIAGRSREKLDAVRRTLGSDVGAIVADTEDAASIDRLVRKTRVVLTTAGPYALHGEPLVRSCAYRGTDYVDITGETAHVRRLIDRYHDEAVRTGAKLVPFCGFDSVPSDLGALLLVDAFRARGLTTASVKGFFCMSGGMNGGTAASTLALWRNPSDVRAMEDPVLLNPESARTDTERHRNPDPVAPVFDADLGRWVAPFFMGPINTRVVRRSRALAAARGDDYGPAFRYQEYWDAGPVGPASLFAASGAAWGMAMYQTMARIPGAAQMMAPFVRPPGDGPTDAQMDAGYFQAAFVGTASDGSQAWTFLADRGDPGNRVTAKIAGESALALACDRARLPGGAARAGLLTPAAALGSVLVDRLRAAGMQIAAPRSASG